MTGMRVMPITTVSGPASRDEGVVMPWLMWWRGLAESSSPLITATGPANTRHIHQARQRKGDLKVLLTTWVRTARGQQQTVTSLPYHPWPHLQDQFLQTHSKDTKFSLLITGYQIEQILLSSCCVLPQKSTSPLTLSSSERLSKNRQARKQPK